MEIKSTKVLTKAEKLTIERIKKKIEEAIKKTEYDFKNQDNNKKLREWLMK